MFGAAVNPFSPAQFFEMKVERVRVCAPEAGLRHISDMFMKGSDAYSIPEGSSSISEPPPEGSRTYAAKGKTMR